jgi:hypothetical protein
MKSKSKKAHVKNPVIGHKAKMLKVPCKCGHRSMGYNENDFDERAVHEGAKIEYEHTCNKELAERISEDHISEMGNLYYVELAKLEKKLKKRKESMPDLRPIHKKNCVKYLKETT